MSSAALTESSEPVMQNLEIAEPVEDNDDDEAVSPRLFKKFAGSYTVTVDRFFLDTEDQGTIPMEFQEKFTLKLIKPDSVIIETSLVSDLGNNAQYYPNLLMLGIAYYQAVDTIHIYPKNVKLNGEPVSSTKARLNFEPPFALSYSKGKIFMETDYIHFTRYPRESYELTRQ